MNDDNFTRGAATDLMVEAIETHFLLLPASEVAHGGLPRRICPICALAVERIRAGGGERALWLAQCTRDPRRRALRQSSF